VFFNRILTEILIEVLCLHLYGQPFRRNRRDDRIDHLCHMRTRLLIRVLSEIENSLHMSQVRLQAFKGDDLTIEVDVVPRSQS